MIQISVVIPVRNRAEQIRQAVRGVLAGDFCGERHELIVVDNDSTDETAQAAAAEGARVIHEPQPNRCRARNAGAQAAGGRWLAFIDSDCVPAAGWLGALEAATREAETGHPRRALIAGGIDAAEPSGPVEAYIDRRRWLDQEKFLTPGRRFSPPFAATANLAVRREVYLELGGLDPGLARAGEDADFCWRAAEAGWELHHAPEARVIHAHRATLGGLWHQARDYGIGNAELFARWRGRWGARVWVEPNHYVWALKGLLKAPVALAVGSTPLDRREPLYDFVANTAQAVGRIQGGARRGVLVI